MGDYSPQRRTGCGILNVVFGRRNMWPRRSTSTGSINVPSNITRISSGNTKRRRGGGGGSDEAATFFDSNFASEQPQRASFDRVIPRSTPKNTPQMYSYNTQTPNFHQNDRKTPDREFPSSFSRSSPSQGGKKVPQGTMGLSGELETMIADHQRSKGFGNLMRASSSNVMLYGNLGNLKQPGGGNANSKNADQHLPRATKEETSGTNGKYPTSVMGNVVTTTTKNRPSEESEKPEKRASLCRALSTRMDPETLKIMGNEDYKSGNFAEALSLYEAAIAIDPNKASYRSNKSAALTALGRLLEAVFECREAIRIEPFYQRAHNRLATLYLRLGEAEKAMYHYKQAGAESDPEIVSKAKDLQFYLTKCTDAKRLRDWNTLLKDIRDAIAAGADAAPQIYCLQAEALLKLHRHQEADEALMKSPNFDIDDCTKFFGPIAHATILVITAQVDMAAGRFEEAVAAAQRAAKLDPNNKEANTVLRRTKAVAAARSQGNEQFKAGRFSEACGAYGDGLDHDPYNSILLCNRAACWVKLGQIHKAVEDCNTALNVRPSYSKARLRRADCNAKLERWEACVQDYEVLARETPENEDMVRFLKEAQEKLKKQLYGNDVVKSTKVDNVSGSDDGNDVVVISSNQRLRDYVTLPGLSVVLFCNKPGDKQTLHLMAQLCKRYPDVNFLKMEVEDHPSIARSEGLSSLPAFKIYKSGSKSKEIPCGNNELLESSIKFYTST